MSGLSDTLRSFAEVASLPPFDGDGESVVGLRLEKSGTLFIERINDDAILVYLSFNKRDISLRSCLHLLSFCHPKRRLAFPFSLGMVGDETYVIFCRLTESSLSLPLLEDVIGHLLRLSSEL